MSEMIIAPTAICANCDQQRGDHSGGSFLCPELPAHNDNRFQFTDSEFAHAGE